MKQYDVIIIGSGAGAIVAEEALAHGMETALVDSGPVGGTCLNVGCIPSKLLIYPADRVMEIREAAALGIRAEIESIDFGFIMERMRRSISRDRDRSRESIEAAPGIDFYSGESRFVEDYTLETGGKRIRGEKIFIASGARPLIPPIQGLDDVDYLTNETVLDLRELPSSLVIVGGGYIAVEYAHFFSAMGAEVTLIQRGERLVKEEEPEISARLRERMETRMDVYTGVEAVEVRGESGGCTVSAREKSSGRTLRFQAERILVAAGRISNADRLQVGNTGVGTDDRGFIAVNNRMETGKENIWAFGDAVGRKMFRHAANREAELVWRSVFHGEGGEMDFDLVPHAVFSHPEIASVGLTEAEALQVHGDDRVWVGFAGYSDIARGEAMGEEHGFAKAVLEGEGGLLGFHIIGPRASILIQEVVNAMAAEGTFLPILLGIHIHPALSEIVPAAIENAQPASAVKPA
ncbi:MAG: dihydrolipoyl dehydrogenase [Deltaproteobacteria bacterium]|nr:dihydrolipoyl dehydrogenase [Deltaproteobacteria bacterium]